MKQKKQTKRMKSERNIKEIMLYIVAAIMAIYTIAKAYSAIKQMITYCSAYGISITSKLFVVVVYVIEVCLPYISLAVLFFLFAKMHKRIRFLEKKNEGMRFSDSDVIEADNTSNKEKNPIAE